MRSANRSARVTERALLAGIRPVLMTSRLEDPSEKVGFADDHWVRVPGGRGTAEVTDKAIYLTLALRNVGTGLGVLDRWDAYPRPALDAQVPPKAPEDFRRLTRDLYVPAGDTGFWQGALRDPEDPLFQELKGTIERAEPITIDLLYGDHEGGQRTFTRFSLAPVAEGPWLATTSRHWNLDRSDPR